MNSKLSHYKALQPLADETGFTYWFLRKLCMQNKVKFIRSGTKYYINEDDLADYLSQLEQEN